jgi:hypothetical protein
MPWNKVLSLTDAEWLVKMYKNGADHRKIYAEVYGAKASIDGVVVDKTPVDGTVKGDGVAEKTPVVDGAAKAKMESPPSGARQGSSETTNVDVGFMLVIVLCILITVFLRKTQR